VPAAKLGLGYAAGGIRTLRELVGPSFAAEIFYTARQFSAEDARIMGLVNRVVPEAELENLVADYVNRITANAPLTIAAAKQAIIELGKYDADQDLDLCQELVENCFSSEDYQEGRLAFMEKRKPNFQGK
jgi:enoyl-CoA hydratase/carnithine racemase